MLHKIKYICIIGISLLVVTLSIIFIFPQFKVWVPYFYYIVASTCFIAIPHEPLVFYYGKLFGLYLPVIIGIIPTILGCYIDYLVIRPIVRHRKFDRIKETKVYEKTLKYFKKAPFLAVMITAAFPIPFYPVRFLSVATGYSMYYYMSAVLAGRIPKFIVLAAGGKLLNIPDGYIIGAFIAIFIFYCLKYLFKKYGKLSWKTSPVMIEKAVHIGNKSD